MEHMWNQINLINFANFNWLAAFQNMIKFTTLADKSVKVPNMYEYLPAYHRFILNLFPSLFHSGAHSKCMNSNILYRGYEWHTLSREFPMPHVTQTSDCLHT